MRLHYLSTLALLWLISCSPDKKTDSSDSGSSWVRPESGASVNLGDSLELKLQLNDSASVDSIVYLVDGVRQAKSSEDLSGSMETRELPLGNRLITARIFRKGQQEEINTNIIVRSNLVPKKFGYKVRQVFDHDTSSYTQGLEYHNAYFYESDGGNTPETGYSSLRRVEPASGKVLQRVDFPNTFFAEGLTLVDDKIVLLSWQNNVGLVFDKASMKQLSEFPYQNSTQGWGLCSDAKRLYKSDGSNLIYFLNRENYREEGYIEVFDNNGPVDQLNELELIDGKLYANVYNTDRVVIIDPKNGQVTGDIDMSDLLPAIYNYPGTDVLNGIAWDSKGKRLFMTGKRWAKLFQVELIEKEL
ncbi:glutaminyl-peptide cyclotransferase [Flavihumibacter sp. R14]|nr:glutaminyl-peptide cyclotransferase [Flavihumibacter soli]